VKVKGRPILPPVMTDELRWTLVLDNYIFTKSFVSYF
jgi:hypothetical protein